MIPDKPIFRFLPVACTYPATTTGSLWTGTANLPNDGDYAIIGIAAPSALARCNSISSFGAGDGNIIRGTTFIIDALAQANLQGLQLFPGPVPLPGVPGVRVSALYAPRQAQVSITGVLTVGGAGNVFNSSANAADLMLVLIRQDALPAEAKKFRPLIANISVTTAATSAAGTATPLVVTSTFGGQITLTRLQTRKTDLTAPAVAAVTSTWKVAITPGGRASLRAPWTGMVPAVLLGGTEAAQIGGVTPPLLRLDLNNGENVQVDYSDAATGSANSSRVDHVFLGYEQVP